MSEYQYVHFMAIDRPLDDKQLEFMQRQSSRAEITRWSFTNEYNFGDFRGNAREMLRHGYDVHLHYANFGIRKLMIRLPAGLPCDRKTFEAFEIKHSIEWNADKKGKGGILEIEPEADAGSYEDDIWNATELLPEIAPVRDLLIGGDLRPLSIAWLGCSYDEEMIEPPVPAGLDKLTPALRAMAGLYEVSLDLIAAVAQQSPPLPAATDAGKVLEQWIAKQSQDSLRKLVGQFLADDAGATRAETLARLRDETGQATWPLSKPTRTLAQLQEMTEDISKRRLLGEKKAREAARRKRLAAIAANPDKTIANVEKLAKERSTASYQQAASELADLREALGPERGPAEATAVAEKLRRANPKLNLLISALRKKDLLG